jgi:hypothetical protein
MSEMQLGEIKDRRYCSAHYPGDGQDPAVQLPRGQISLAGLPNNR